MNFDTQTAAQYAGEKLDKLLERATRDSAAVAEQNDIPSIVAHFAELRDAVQALAAKVTLVQKHVDSLSNEVLPTLFMNQNIKTINVLGVGRVSVNVRWSASMLNKQDGIDWLRATGNNGLIIETVNAQTLGAFAKDQQLAGAPLPSEIFKVSSSSYTSITATK